MNNIFIISTKFQRIKYFKKYFNIFNEKTNIKMNVIIDDRNMSNDEIKKFYDLNWNIYKATNVIEYVAPLFSNENIMRKILDNYGVSIKWLLFIFINKKLSIQKSMIIDDDTLMIKPLDHYFKHDYVIYREQLSAMSKRVRSLLSGIYPEIDIEKLNKERMFVNSGQILFNWHEDLFNHIDKAFCQEMLDFVEEGKEKYKKRTATEVRKVGGMYWIIEQYIYAVFFYKFKEKYDIVNFNNDILLYTFRLKEEYKFKRNIPCFIHYLPKDKEAFYKHFLPAVDKLIQKKQERKI